MGEDWREGVGRVVGVRGRGQRRVEIVGRERGWEDTRGRRLDEEMKVAQKVRVWT